MSCVQVDIALSAHELELAYQGVSQVSCIARDGRRIQFPVNILWPFITRDGVYGSFEIEFDQYRKFKEIRRLTDHFYDE